MNLCPEVQFWEVIEVSETGRYKSQYSWVEQSALDFTKTQQNTENKCMTPGQYFQVNEQILKGQVSQGLSGLAQTLCLTHLHGSKTTSANT